jgi:hypothetical protein
MFGFGKKAKKAKIQEKRAVINLLADLQYVVAEVMRGMEEDKKHKIPDHTKDAMARLKAQIEVTRDMVDEEYYDL